MKVLISPKVSNASVEPPNKVVTLPSINPSAVSALNFSTATASDNKVAPVAALETSLASAWETADTNASDVAAAAVEALETSLASAWETADTIASDASTTSAETAEAIASDFAAAISVVVCVPAVPLCTLATAVTKSLICFTFNCAMYMFYYFYGQRTMIGASILYITSAVLDSLETTLNFYYHD